MIVLESPKCSCGAYLIGRQFYRHNADGELVRYQTGDRFEIGNVHEVTVCPRCDR